VAHGGKRPGAGRKPGSKDRATAEQGATLAELARAHTGTALNVLVQVAQASESDAARVSAANAILDRGYGKPAQISEVTGKDGGPIVVTDDKDLARLIVFQLTKASRDPSTVN
jgi:hypothetical protein